VTEHKKYSCVNKNEPKTGVFADLLLFWFAMGAKIYTLVKFCLEIIRIRIRIYFPRHVHCTVHIYSICLLAIVNLIKIKQKLLKLKMTRIFLTVCSLQ
jgi:hypothetical protein